jgi:hypothetical protein
MANRVGLPALRGYTSPVKALGLAALAAVGIALAAPAHADPDTDFASQLHTYGIYGPRDYNAWLGKISCERLHAGVDANASKSVDFLSHNLARDATQVQKWEFLGTAISVYCPDLAPILQNVAQ